MYVFLQSCESNPEVQVHVVSLQLRFIFGISFNIYYHYVLIAFAQIGLAEVKGYSDHFVCWSVCVSGPKLYGHLYINIGILKELPGDFKSCKDQKKRKAFLKPASV